MIASLGWTLNVPGYVDVLRSDWFRPLASLSFNRWALAASVALVILAAIGLETLRTARLTFRPWFLVPMLLTVGFCGMCLYRRFTLDSLKAINSFSRCATTSASGTVIGRVAGMGNNDPPDALRQVDPLGSHRPASVGTVVVRLERTPPGRHGAPFPTDPGLGPACDAPHVAAVSGAQLKALPPNLNRTHGLEDIRGYDAVDPGNFIKLFNLAIDRQESIALSYAWTQYALPLARQTAGALALHPVANLLNVRYLIFRQPPPPELPVILQGDGYWIAENRAALPRAYVPGSVRVVQNDQQVLLEMASFDFDPRKTAFMTHAIRLPDVMRGQASVRYESPIRTEIDAEMRTEGLVLLSDSWNAGWRAELDGVSCPIFRVDVALRGFRVPVGKHRIVCLYDPPSVSLYGSEAAGGRRDCSGLLILGRRVVPRHSPLRQHDYLVELSRTSR